MITKCWLRRDGGKRIWIDARGDVEPRRIADLAELKRAVGSLHTVLVALGDVPGVAGTEP